MKTTNIQNKKTIVDSDVNQDNNDNRRDAMNRVSTIADNRSQTSALTQMKELSEDNPRVIAQRQEFIESISGDQPEVQSNQTGMPDNLKTGLENLSGMDLSDMKVHYNSSKPAQLNALAYAQGNEIHLGPGQEKHLPHEGWHVVQQRQGRVKPTTQMKGAAINDDSGLEQEADVMGEKALQINRETPPEVSQAGYGNQAIQQKTMIHSQGCGCSSCNSDMIQKKDQTAQLNTASQNLGLATIQMKPCKKHGEEDCAKCKVAKSNKKHNPKASRGGRGQSAANQAENKAMDEYSMANKHLGLSRKELDRMYKAQN